MEPRREKKLQLKNTPDAPLTERQIVEATIAFTNGARLEIEGLVRRGIDKETGDAALALQIRVAKAFQELSKEDGGKLGGESFPQGPFPTSVDEYRRAVRVTTREIISDVLNKPKVAAGVIVRRELVSHVHQKPVVRQTEQGLSFRSYYEFNNFVELVDVGVLLLADVERGFREKLCECQLDGCGVFFFEKKPKTGRPQRKYCTPSHMLEAHSLNAPKRMARRRRAALAK